MLAIGPARHMKGRIPTTLALWTIKGKAKLERVTAARTCGPAFITQKGIKWLCTRLRLNDKTSDGDYLGCPCSAACKETCPKDSSLSGKPAPLSVLRWTLLPQWRFSEVPVWQQLLLSFKLRPPGSTTTTPQIRKGEEGRTPQSVSLVLLS